MYSAMGAIVERRGVDQNLGSHERAGRVTEVDANVERQDVPYRRSAHLTCGDEPSNENDGSCPPSARWRTSLLCASAARWTPPSPLTEVGTKAELGQRARPSHTATAESGGEGWSPLTWSRSTARKNAPNSSAPLRWASAVQNARFGPIAVASILTMVRFSPSFS